MVQKKDKRRTCTDNKKKVVLYDLKLNGFPKKHPIINIEKYS